jgi:hypothetical protein
VGRRLRDKTQEIPNGTTMEEGLWNTMEWGLRSILSKCTKEETILGPGTRRGLRLIHSHCGGLGDQITLRISIKFQSKGTNYSTSVLFSK